MSATSRARRTPRRTARVWCSISSMVTGSVFSCPSTTMPSESPTSTTSTPASSSSRAVGKSYAVRQTILPAAEVEEDERDFRARMSGTVILPLPASNAELMCGLRCRSLASGYSPYPSFSLAKKRLRRQVAGLRLGTAAARAPPARRRASPPRRLARRASPRGTAPCTSSAGSRSAAARAATAATSLRAAPA